MSAQALRALAPRGRRAVFARDYEGQPISTVAGLLGMTEASTRQFLTDQRKLAAAAVGRLRAVPFALVCRLRRWTGAEQPALLCAPAIAATAAALALTSSGGPPLSTWGQPEHGSRAAPAAAAAYGLPLLAAVLEQPIWPGPADGAPEGGQPTNGEDPGQPWRVEVGPAGIGQGGAPPTEHDVVVRACANGTVVAEQTLQPAAGPGAEVDTCTITQDSPEYDHGPTSVLAAVVGP